MGQILSYRPRALAAAYVDGDAPPPEYTVKFTPGGPIVSCRNLVLDARMARVVADAASSVAAEGSTLHIDMRRCIVHPGFVALMRRASGARPDVVTITLESTRISEADAAALRSLGAALHRPVFKRQPPLVFTPPRDAADDDASDDEVLLLD